MKRHPSLAPLSREHHGALLLARLLQKDAPPYKSLPVDIDGKASYASKFYGEELVSHFEAEEKVLALVTGINEKLDQMVQTIMREHRELRSLFQSINGHSNLPELLDSIGKELEIHIHKEERELFPAIQETCTEAQLKTIETSLSSKL
jgi:iron-sulfur cluster repair protein YtfE (RIC family)